MARAYFLHPQGEDHKLFSSGATLHIYLLSHSEFITGFSPPPPQLPPERPCILEAGARASVECDV